MMCTEWNWIDFKWSQLIPILDGCWLQLIAIDYDWLKLIEIDCNWLLLIENAIGLIANGWKYVGPHS